MDRDFSGWKLIKMESLSLLLCTSPGPRRERGRSEVPQERVQGSRREGGAGPEELKKKVSGNVSGFFFFSSWKRNWVRVVRPRRTAAPAH